MSNNHKTLDELDKAILKILQMDCRTSLDQIAKRLGVPKSTVHYRIKRLEAEKIIEGYYAKVNASKLGQDYVTITLVRAKYGQDYHEKLGNVLAHIPGVWAVYFVFGDIDFIVLTRSKNREDFMKKLEKIMSMEEIERTSTQVVAKILKEDPRIEL